MLELRLGSGDVVSFDGRVVEIFRDGRPSARFHLAHLGALQAAETADGGSEVELEDGEVTLAFGPREALSCGRLLAAIAQAQAALERPVAG